MCHFLFSSNIFYCLCTTESTNNGVGLQVLATLVTALPLSFSFSLCLASECWSALKKIAPLKEILSFKSIPREANLQPLKLFLFIKMTKRKKNEIRKKKTAALDDLDRKRTVFL